MRLPDGSSRAIGRGLLVYLGVGKEDGAETAGGGTDASWTLTGAAQPARIKKQAKYRRTNFIIAVKL